MVPSSLISPWVPLPKMPRGDAMCFAGIEENVRRMLQKRELAEEIAAKARVRAFATRVHHGHVHVLVEDQGWVRSVDLLEPYQTRGFEPIARPAKPRMRRVASASAGR